MLAARAFRLSAPTRPPPPSSTFSWTDRPRFVLLSALYRQTWSPPSGMRSTTTAAASRTSSRSCTWSPRSRPTRPQGCLVSTAPGWSPSLSPNSSITRLLVQARDEGKPCLVTFRHPTRAMVGLCHSAVGVGRWRQCGVESSGQSVGRARGAWDRLKWQAPLGFAETPGLGRCVAARPRWMISSK